MKEIKRNKLISPTDGCDCTRIEHIRRIAWFVVNGNTDPITISPKLDWPIIDGNHRFFASVIRGDETIKAKVR